MAGDRVRAHSSEPPQEIAKRGQIDGLDPMGGEARVRDGLTTKLLVSGEGHENRSVPVAVHARGHLVPAHAGQRDVEEHEPGAGLLVELERSRTVVRDHDAMPPVREQKREAVRRVRIVVDDEDGLDRAQVRLRPPRLVRVRITSKSATPSTIQTQGCVYHVSVPTATAPP